MRIISWNVNGIRAIEKKNVLNTFLLKRKPQIFCIQETKLSEKALDATKKKMKEHVKGFKYRYYATSTVKKGYSGVSVWSKIKPINVTDGIGVDADNEGRTLTLEFENFYLVTVYTPNSGQQLKRLTYRTREWDVEFRKYVQTLMKNKQVIVCGDLNCANEPIDLVDGDKKSHIAGYTPQERAKFKELLQTTKLVDTYRKKYPEKKQYTYWSYRTKARERNVGWRIDYFLVSPDLKYKDAKIHDNQMGSDHCPIELVLH